MHRVEVELQVDLRACRIQRVIAAETRHLPRSRCYVGHSEIVSAADRQIESSVTVEIHLRSNLRSLVVVEALACLVGKCEVRCPGNGKAAAFGAEDHELEAELPSVVRPQVARVVPPFGKSVVWCLIVGNPNGQRV